MSDTFEDVNKVVATFYPVRDYVNVDKVVNAPQDSDYGVSRSPWYWFRLANGDLVFGCFPQDELYMELEQPVSEDYVQASKLGEVRYAENDQ